MYKYLMKKVLCDYYQNHIYNHVFYKILKQFNAEVFVEYGNKHMRSSQSESTEILQICCKNVHYYFHIFYTNADNQPLIC